MILDKEQFKIVKKLCDKYQLSEEQVIDIIESPFKFIRKEIKSIEINEKESKESFESKIKNFNIPYLGKLYGNYYNYKNIKQCQQQKVKKSMNLKKE